MVWGLIDCGRRRTGGEAGSDKTDLVGAGRLVSGDGLLGSLRKHRRERRRERR